MKFNFNADIRLSRSKLVALLGTGLLSTVGCSGGARLPEYDPAAAGRQAMEMYDTDGDGFVAGEELEKAPGLNAAMKTLDANGDSKVSADEVAARVERWRTGQIGFMNFSCKVLLDGKPMPDGVITFVPEEFLSGVIQEAVSEINYGDADPLIPKEKRPTPDSPPGVQAGLYKVKISRVVNGQETIPARYNSETTLGQEVSWDDPRMMSHNVIFKITSK